MVERELHVMFSENIPIADGASASLIKIYAARQPDAILPFLARLRAQNPDFGPMTCNSLFTFYSKIQRLDVARAILQAQRASVPATQPLTLSFYRAACTYLPLAEAVEWYREGARFGILRLDVPTTSSSFRLSLSRLSPALIRCYVVCYFDQVYGMMQGTLGPGV